MARTTRRNPGTQGGSTRRGPATSSGRRPQGRGGSSSAGGPRSSVRPGSAAGQRSGPQAGGGRFAKSSTKRLAVLAAILVVLALMLIPTLRGYLGQRAQIAALEEEVAQRSAAVDRLDGELARWEDPAYVEQQARARLKFVRPGETSYQVLDAEGLTGAALAESGSVVRPNEAADTTWYGRVWSSLDAADSLSPKDVNAPLAPIAPDAGQTLPTTPGSPASSGTGSQGSEAPATTGDAGTSGTATGAGRSTGDGEATREETESSPARRGEPPTREAEATGERSRASEGGEATRESTARQTSERAGDSGENPGTP